MHQYETNKKGEKMEVFVLKRHGLDDYPLKSWVVIGQDAGCTLAVTDPQTSPRHARIELNENKWTLKDLRSEHGTWLNDTRISEAFLEPGDWIRIGQTELQFNTNKPAESCFPIRSKNILWDEVLQSLDHVARTDHPVLLLGPSGTGKDVIAQAIHKQSRRHLAPFISVNCSALTETLVESELFGHIKGSFTGAIADRKGAFEAARGGTLFLDEIGDLPQSLQAKLLRALENQEVRPVGSDRVVKTDVRVIAATHQNLHEKIRDGSFRSDLFFRLNVVTVMLPSLCHRVEDFEDLLYHFCRNMRVRFSIDAIQRLKQHEWPGNIRELRNLVARASALYPRQSIEIHHIERLIGPLLFESANTDEGHESPSVPMPVIKEIEKQMILKRLKSNRGNQRRTALDLGMPKSTLHDRIRAYGIDPVHFKT
jgi:DNA-binding NtrC family response regulator